MGPCRDIKLKNSLPGFLRVLPLEVIEILDLYDENILINMFEEFLASNNNIKFKKYEEMSLVIKTYNGDFLWNAYNIFISLMQFKFFTEKILVIDELKTEFKYMEILNFWVNNGVIDRVEYVDHNNYKPFNKDLIDKVGIVNKFSFDVCTKPHILSLYSDVGISRFLRDQKGFEFYGELSESIKIGRPLYWYDYNIGREFIDTYLKHKPSGGACPMYPHKIRGIEGVEDYNNQVTTSLAIFPLKNISYNEDYLAPKASSNGYETCCQWERTMQNIINRKGLKFYALCDFVMLLFPL